MITKYKTEQKKDNNNKNDYLAIQNHNIVNLKPKP